MTLSDTAFGLRHEVVLQMLKVFAAFEEIDEVILFGSRAKGNFKPGSDIDLSIKGQNVNLTLLNKVSLALDELMLPNIIDLNVYGYIKDEALLEHISRVGVVIYKKSSSA